MQSAGHFPPDPMRARSVWDSRRFPGKEQLWQSH